MERTNKPIWKNLKSHLLKVLKNQKDDVTHGNDEEVVMPQGKTEVADEAVFKEDANVTTEVKKVAEKVEGPQMLKPNSLRSLMAEEVIADMGDDLLGLANDVKKETIEILFEGSTINERELIKLRRAVLEKKKTFKTHDISPPDYVEDPFLYSMDLCKYMNQFVANHALDLKTSSSRRKYCDELVRIMKHPVLKERARAYDPESTVAILPFDVHGILKVLYPNLSSLELIKQLGSFVETHKLLKYEEFMTKLVNLINLGKIYLQESLVLEAVRPSVPLMVLDALDKLGPAKNLKVLSELLKESLINYGQFQVSSLEFIQRENIMGMTVGNQTQLTQSNNQRNQVTPQLNQASHEKGKDNRSTKKTNVYMDRYCEYHESSTHSTSECKRRMEFSGKPVDEVRKLLKEEKLKKAHALKRPNSGPLPPSKRTALPQAPSGNGQGNPSNPGFEKPKKPDRPDRYDYKKSFHSQQSLAKSNDGETLDGYKMKVKITSNEHCDTVRCMVNGKTLDCPIDSLATVTEITIKAVIELGLISNIEKVPKGSITFVLSNGVEIEPVGFVWLTFYQPIAQRVKAYILSHNQQDWSIKLGRDVIKSLNLSYRVSDSYMATSIHKKILDIHDRSFIYKSKPDLVTNSITLEKEAIMIKNYLQEVIEANKQCAGLSKIEPLKFEYKKKPFTRQIPIPWAIRDQLKAKLADWTRTGFIEPSDAVDCNSSIICVKKANGDIRILLDLRELNSSLIYDKSKNNSIPNIQKITSEALKFKYFAKFDLENAYASCAVDKSCRDPLTFEVFGQRYRYCSLPQGLSQAPSHFQMTMNKLMVNIGSEDAAVWVYLDDILVGAVSIEDLQNKCAEVLKILNANNLKVNWEKSVLVSDRITILGHEICNHQVTIHRAAAMKFDFKAPCTNKKRLERIIGSCNFFRPNIPGLSTLAEPLEALKKKFKDYSRKFPDSAVREHINALEKAIKESVPLDLYDPSLQLYLCTDASKTGIGSYLYQYKSKELESKYEEEYDMKMSMMKKSFPDTGVPEVNTGWAELAQDELVTPVESVDGPTHDMDNVGVAVVTESRGNQEVTPQSHGRTGVQHEMHQDPMDETSPNITNVGEEENVRRHGVETQDSVGVNLEQPKSKVHVERSPHENPTNQKSNDKWKDVKFIAFYSRSLKEVERRYPPTKLEALAIRDSLSHFHEFLYCNSFILETDHLPLKSLFNGTSQLLNATLSHWIDTFTLYQFEIRYLEGNANFIADFLSRLYETSEKEETEIALSMQSWMIQKLESQFPKTKLLDRRIDMENKKIEELLSRCHSHESGHLGIKNSLDFIYRTGHRWEGIVQDVTKRVKGCKTCCFHDLKKGYRPVFHDQQLYPFDKLEFDLKSAPCKSKSGKTMILVVTDTVSNYVWLRPLRSKKSREVAESLIGIFCEWGFPLQINSDLGGEFLGKVTKVLSQLSIKKGLHSAYSPTSTSKVESQIKSVGKILTRLMEDEMDGYALPIWDTYLQKIQLIMNSKSATINQSSAFALMLGRESRYPEAFIPDKSNVPPDQKFMEDKWTFIYDTIYPRLAQIIKAKYQGKYEKIDAKREKDFVTFIIGDLVMKEVNVVKSKWDRPYEGPFVVTRLFGDRHASLQEISTGDKWRRIPFTKLKHFKTMEEIIDQRTNSEGKPEFLMRMTDDSNVWLNDKTIPKELIDEWLEIATLDIDSIRKEEISRWKHLECLEGESPEYEDHSENDSQDSDYIEEDDVEESEDEMSEEE